MALTSSLRFKGIAFGLGIPLLIAPAHLFAQESRTTKLQDAIRIALDKNPRHREAFADTQAASFGVGEARASLLPRVTFSETASRGNDPVYVFGSKLRQQRFTAADFSLNLLNTPDSFGNFSNPFRWLMDAV